MALESVNLGHTLIKHAFQNECPDNPCYCNFLGFISSMCSDTLQGGPDLGYPCAGWTAKEHNYDEWPIPRTSAQPNARG